MHAAVEISRESDRAVVELIGAWTLENAANLDARLAPVASAHGDAASWTLQAAAAFSLRTVDIEQPCPAPDLGSHRPATSRKP